MTEPKTMTAAEQDKRLEERTEQIRQETEALDAQNKKLLRRLTKIEEDVADLHRLWRG
jgi:phage shock protein A